MSSADIFGQTQSVTDLLYGFGTDFLAFIVLTIIIAGFAFYFGRDRLMPLIAGIYTAIPLYMNFPFMSHLNGNAYFEIGLYIVFVILGLVAFSGLSYFIGGESLGFLKLLILSVVTAGLLLAVSIHILPVEKIYTISAATKVLFTSAQSYFWWLLAPLVGVFFFSRG